MAIDDRAAADGQHRRTKDHSRLCAVRLWSEEVVGGSQYRGSVQDVGGGAFRRFRAWSDLTAFMIVRVNNDECAQSECVEGGAPWPMEELR